MEKEIKDMNAAEYAAFIARVTAAAKAEDDAAADNDAHFAQFDDEDDADEMALDSNFEEADHPRAPDGKFGSGGAFVDIKPAVTTKPTGRTYSYHATTNPDLVAISSTHPVGGWLAPSGLGASVLGVAETVMPVAEAAAFLEAAAQRGHAVARGKDLSSNGLFTLKTDLSGNKRPLHPKK